MSTVFLNFLYIFYHSRIINIYNICLHLSKVYTSIHKYVIIILGSDKMKKYDILLSLNKKKKKLNNLVSKKKLSSKVIIRLSQEIDKLQNELYQV